MSFEELNLNSETIERHPPEAGGTVIVMQRHGEYDRETGSLTESGLENSEKRSAEIIDEMISEIPENERRNVKILVVASPTEMNGGQRSMETADAAISSIKKVFEKYGIPDENLLRDTPRPVEDVEEPRIFQGDLQYMNFLFDRYGRGTKEFWRAYEEDVHKAEREKMGAEGPIEMSDRYAHFMDVLGRYSRQFHYKEKEEKKRLIVWLVSHYDTITTYIKNHVANIPQEQYLPVDYDGGVSLYISSNQDSHIKIGDKDFEIALGKKDN